MDIITNIIIKVLFNLGLLASGSSAFWQWYAYLSHSTDTQFRATVAVSCSWTKKNKRTDLKLNSDNNETIWRALHVTKIIIREEMQVIPSIKLGKLTELHFSVSLKCLHLLSCLLLHSHLTCGAVENKILKNPSPLCPSLPQTFKVRYIWLLNKLQNNYWNTSSQ